MYTKQELVNALSKLAATTREKRLSAVMLDLRGNPGGLLSSVLACECVRVCARVCACVRVCVCMCVRVCVGPCGSVMQAELAINSAPTCHTKKRTMVRI